MSSSNKSILKKSVLTAVFGSVAFLAGCGQHSKPAPSAQQPTQPTEAQMLQQARGYFDAQGASVIQTSDCGTSTQLPDGSYDVGCGVTVQNKTDDGLTRSGYYWTRQKKFEMRDCALRDNDAAADKLDDTARAVFRADALQAFGKMEFKVLGPYAEATTTMTVDGGACGEDLNNDFLLRAKATGLLYKGSFAETYNFGEKDITASGITNIESIDRPVPRKAPPAPQAQDDPPAQQPSAEEQPPASSGSPASKLCVGICAGPHIDLQTGKLKLYGAGPGLKLQ